VTDISFSYIREADDYVSPNGKRLRRVDCLCNCGSYTTKRLSSVLDGNTTTCGAPSCNSVYTHGDTGTLLHKRWCQMIGRVNHDPHYATITIYKPWLEYIVFKDWALKNGFDETTKHTSLERTDSRGNYEPSNCYFTELKNQSKNTDRSKWWYIDGVRYESANDAAVALNTSPSSIVRACDGGTRLRADGTYTPPKENCWSEGKYDNDTLD